MYFPKDGLYFVWPKTLIYSYESDVFYTFMFLLVHTRSMATVDSLVLNNEVKIIQ